MEQMLSQETLQTVKEFLVTEGIDWGINILAALAIFMVGKWVAKRVSRLVEKALSKGNVDTTLTSFVGNILYGLLVAFVVIAALTKLGIETTSIAAIFAAAGLAIGLALQGSLSNLAAGVMIILFRPFKVGDYVEVAGTAGTVEEVNIFTTTMKDPSNVEVIVPNGAIIGGVITNYTTRGTRRLDLVFGIGYGDDIKQAKTLLTDILESDERVLKDPAFVVAVGELGDSSVNLYVRPWVNTSDYWALRFDLIETVKLRFDEAGITIPFPQRDVNLYQVHSDEVAHAA